MSHSKIWRVSSGIIIAAKTSFSSGNSSDYKILLVKRAVKSSFMPETYVFPGGGLTTSDSSVGWTQLYEKFGFNKESFAGLRTENPPEILQSNCENGLPRDFSLRICAIRETFEECGVLLCRRPEITTGTNSSWGTFIGGHNLRSWQLKVNEDPLEFLNLCHHFKIVPDIWALHIWSHWMTPPTSPTKKFNTLFFLTTLHQMPSVHVDEREIQDLIWTTPDQCLQMQAQKSILLPPPQQYEISRIRGFDDVAQLSSFARERGKLGVETFWSSTVKTNNEFFLTLPGDDCHPTVVNENTELMVLSELPDPDVKHRMLIKDHYLYEIEIQNLKPKYNHVIPVIKSKI